MSWFVCRKMDDEVDDEDDFEADLAMMDEIKNEMAQEMEVDETGKDRIYSKKL